MKINPPKWTPEEDAIIKELSDTLSGSSLFSAISEKTRRTKVACQIRATRIGMLGPNKKKVFGRKDWTAEEIEWLRCHIKEVGNRDWADSAATFLKRRKSSVLSQAHNLGIAYKKEFNEDYFAKWNNDSAYAGGYIWADGSIENSNGNHRLRLRCSPCDDYVIFDIAKRIGGHKVQKPVLPSIKPTTMNKSGFVKSNGLTSLSISGKKFVQNMQNFFGIVPNKSNVDPVYPKIPDEFFGSFLRGVFDGDGSIGLNERGECNCVVIYGSDRFLTGLSEQAARVLGVQIVPLKRNRKLGRISWHSRSDIIAIYKAFYADPTWTWLERKRVKMHTTLVAQAIRDMGIIPEKKKKDVA